MHIAFGAAHTGQAFERLRQLRAQSIEIDAGAFQQMPGRAAVLIEQRQHQVQRLDELMIAPQRQ